jgi:hypothetical protein
MWDSSERSLDAMIGRDQKEREAERRESLKRLDSYDPYGRRVDRDTPERELELKLTLAIEKARSCNRC